jgi:hypothetical protein
MRETAATVPAEVPANRDFLGFIMSLSPCVVVDADAQPSATAHPPSPERRAIVDAMQTRSMRGSARGCYVELRVIMRLSV